MEPPHDTRLRPQSATEQRLRALVAAAPDGVLVTGEDGTILLANPALEQLFGYGPGELQGLPIEELVPERLRPRHAGHRERFRAGPGIRPLDSGLELTGRRRDGSEVQVDIALGPLEDGERRLTLAFVRDTTGRRLAEERLRRGEAWAKLVEGARDYAIFMLDADGRVATWNAGAEHITGYAADAILGTHVSVLLEGGDRRALREALRMAAEVGDRKSVV